MNKDLLISNISKILNLAESEKEFAFRKTIEKVSEKLKYDEALRIDKLGVFQLKKEPMPRYERSQLLPSAPKEKRTLVYSPPFEKLEGDIKSLFLTLDLDDLNLSVNDDVDRVFSISVNKPLIPLSETDDTRTVDFKSTGEKDINTDLEFKIVELVDSSEILKDYDIWEDYLNRNDPENKSSLENVDDDFDLNDLMFNESFTKANVSPSKTDFDNHNEFVSPAVAPLDDDLKAFEEASRIERKFGNTIDQEIDNLPPISESALQVDPDSTIDEPLIGLQNLNEELKAINGDDEKLDDQNDDELEDFEMPNNLQVDDSIIDTENDSDVTIDSNNSIVDGDNELSDEQIDNKEIPEDNDKVFNEIEDYLESEGDTEKIVDEIINDDEEKPEKTDEIEDEKIESGTIDDTTNEVDDTIPNEPKEATPVTEESSAKDNDKTPLYKRPLFIYSSAAIILLLILIALFYPSSEMEQPEIIEENISPAVQEQISPITENEVTQPEITPPVSETLTASDRTGLYRKVSTDVQAANQIYYDGEVYSVQVSSWRSATIAEREVERLKNAGHDAFIYQVFLESKGSTWNRVRIGYFDTLENAEDFLVKNKF